MAPERAGPRQTEEQAGRRQREPVECGSRPIPAPHKLVVREVRQQHEDAEGAGELENSQRFFVILGPNELRRSDAAYPGICPRGQAVMFAVLRQSGSPDTSCCAVPRDRPSRLQRRLSSSAFFIANKAKSTSSGMIVSGGASLTTLSALSVQFTITPWAIVAAKLDPHQQPKPAHRGDFRCGGTHLQQPSHKFLARRRRALVQALAHDHLHRSESGGTRQRMAAES